MIELKLNKPIYWFICQLYANQLPLRHLFHTLDEKNTGPKGCSGNIGKMLDELKSWLLSTSNQFLLICSILVKPI